MDYKERIASAFRQLNENGCFDCEVSHDDWCRIIMTGDRPCSCTPFVEVIKKSDGSRWSVDENGFAKKRLTAAQRQGE